jgi:hypothetical protein
VKPEDTVDPIVKLVAALPRVAPDPRRADRVRARAHAALARERRSDERLAQGERFVEGLLHPAVAGGLAIAYLSAAIRVAFF